jgi:hypothetical protein
MEGLIKAFLPGDPVFIDSHEGFGGPAHIIETRDCPGCRHKVAMVDGRVSPFWAHDFELSEREGERLDDADIETHRHIEQVRAFLDTAIGDLCRRKRDHDRSKLESPEREVFAEYTAKLKGTTYDSPEYRAFLAEMKPALDHHYARNSHHPEHFTGSACIQCGNSESEPCTCGGPRTSVAGIRGMSLLDLVEMLCDWKAATLRHADGDIRTSIEINQKRFGYSDELKQIFLNTLGVIEAGSTARS